jgi:2-keto-4-pentenoate hydratase/2-oxohepta-3-ene-1,7-dioic acid hydratase in catechol pathway
VPAHPRLHHKLPTALTTNGHAIELPPEVRSVRHGGGLVVVIGGRVPRFTSPADALQYVFGVTAGNDITAAVASPHERRYDGLSWLVGYAADTWAPIGDQLLAGWPGDDLAIEVRVNGAVAARARTGAMRTPVAHLISYLSQFITLDAGDIVFSGGAPALPGMAEVKAGDVVEVAVEGLPVLRNPVIALDLAPLVLATAPATK